MCFLWILGKTAVIVQVLVIGFISEAAESVVHCVVQSGALKKTLYL